MKSSSLAIALLACLAAGSVSAQRSEIQESITTQDMDRYYKWRKDLAKAEAQKQAIQEEWDRFMKQVTDPPAPSTPADKAPSSGTGSIGAMLDKASKIEVPDVAPSPVYGLARNDDEIKKLSEIWGKIQGHAAIHAPELQDAFAGYLWDVYTNDRPLDPVARRHADFVKKQIETEPGQANFPSIGFGQMPSIPKGIVLGTYNTGTRKITLRIADKKVISHEIIHFIDHQENGIGNNVRLPKVVALFDQMRRDKDEAGQAARAEGAAPPESGGGVSEQEKLRVAAEDLAYIYMTTEYGGPGGPSILSSIPPPI